MTGRVVSIKLKNTATVLIERIAMHPLYKKTFTRSKKYLVDDLIGVKLGDIVEIEKVRPISKNKHWRILKVLGRSMAELAEEHMKEKAQQAIAEVMPEEKESEQATGDSEQSEEVKSQNSKVKIADKKSKVEKKKGNK